MQDHKIQTRSLKVAWKSLFLNDKTENFVDFELKVNIKEQSLYVFT